MKENPPKVENITAVDQNIKTENISCSAQPLSFDSAAYVKNENSGASVKQENVTNFKNDINSYSENTCER